MLYHHTPLVAAFTALSLAPVAYADVPKVVSDIPAVASLTAQVMGDLGTPVTLVKPGSSPHTHALRPSEAAAIHEADLVIWMSGDLTPWLDEAIDSRGSGFVSLPLMQTEGTVHHPQRGSHDHHHGEGHEEGHEEGHAEGHKDGHAHHDEHRDEHKDGHAHGDHDEHASHDEHSDHDEHAHDEDAIDPHGWLDPRNGQLWLTEIAEALATADPDHADTYRANAAQGVTALAALETELAAKLAPVADQPFAVFHDAYQYFDHRFGLIPPTAIALGNGASPGPARIAELRSLVTEEGIACAFSEPQFNDRMIDTVFEGTELRRGLLDPLGHEQTPGPDLYPNMLTAMADSIVTCLTTPDD